MGSTAAVAQISSSVMTGTQSLLSGINNAEAARMQGQFQKQQYEFNSRMANIQARQVKEKGEKDVVDLKKSVKRLIGSQRVSLAAQGIELDSGSALEIQEDTALQAEKDAIKIRNNSLREAFNYKMTALDYSGRGGFAEMAGEQKAYQSIVEGGFGFAAGATKGVASYAENFGSSKKRSG